MSLQNKNQRHWSHFIHNLSSLANTFMAPIFIKSQLPYYFDVTFIWTSYDMGRILIYYTLIRFSYDYMFYWRFFIISVSFKKCTVIWHFSDTWQIIIKMEKVLSVQKQLIQGLMNQIGWVSTTQEFTKMNKEAQFEAIRLVARPFSILRLPFMSHSGKFQGSFNQVLFQRFWLKWFQ